MQSTPGITNLLSRALALCILGFVLWDAWHFPVFAHAVVFGLAVYALTLAVEVRVWLLALPVAVAILSVGFWSGRHFWDVFDLFVLVTLAGGLWSRTPWWPRRNAIKVLWPVAAFALVQSAVTLNGLYPLETPVDGSWADYFASTNALREGKGMAWALLLVPMLMQAQRLEGYTARWLVAGMCLGLLAAVLAILWERNLYTGILNFGHAYRVSGWFFELHTGGAAIDVAMAIMLPFAFGLWVWWKKWPVHVGMLGLLALGAYGLFVTFSRANYPAVGAVALVLLVGLLSLPGLRSRRRRAHELKVYVLAAVLLALVPVIMGGTIVERFKTTASDLETRLVHWENSLSLVNPGMEQWVGIGKGAFPRRYHLASAFAGEQLATLFRRIDGDQGYIRFSASDHNGSLDLRQRFRPSSQRMQLKLVARTAPGTRERLLIEFCERHVLRVRAECTWVGTDIADTQGQWREYNHGISLGDLGQGGWLSRSPVDISILNRGIKGGLDISAVRVVDVDGNDRLANSDFSQGMDHWFMVDGNHLRWHVKNIFVYAYVEGGFVGLSVFILVVGLALVRAWRLHRGGDPMGVALAAAIAAGLAIGLFDSVLDAPRVTVLFMFLVFAALTWMPQPVALAARFGAYPSWLPNPLAWLPNPAWLALGLTGLVLGGYLVSSVRSHQFSVPQAMLYYGEKLGLDSETLFDLVNQPPHHLPTDGPRRRVGDGRRIWRDIPQADGRGVCDNSGMEWKAVCWATTGNVAAGRDALQSLLALGDSMPRAYSDYGNGWLLASTYDLLHSHPDLTADADLRIQQRIRRALLEHLLLLNSGGPAVWHGRTNISAQAMLLAAVFKPGGERDEELSRQVHYHFGQLLDTLAASEAWPEGYNYWVNSRGFLVALSGYAFINAFDHPDGGSGRAGVFSRLGHWHIHNTRPDVKATQLGDEGPRIDLQHDTQRVIDLLAAVTRDPWLKAYSQVLAERFGQAGYYKDYTWLRPLLGVSGSQRVASTNLNRLHGMPLADWFGADAMNLFYLRSGWGGDATFMSYRAGHTLSHHAHYDAGHFTLYKGAPLAVTGATYRGDVTAGHRRNYGIRTVSKNSLLVMRPGEVVHVGDDFKNNFSDGGQRLTMPVRNPLSTLQDWRANLGDGLHLEGGRIRAFRHEPESFTYIDSDITRAYNTPEHDEGGEGGKVSLVTRQIVFLRRLDRVLIRDRIVTTDPTYRAKWLLQSMVRPDVEGELALKGVPDNGIVTTGQPEFLFANQRGRLHVLSLLPEDRETLVIGGNDFRFYTDVDGDAATLDGENMGHNSRITSWFEPAMWRLEISDRRDAREQDFLTLLSPAIEQHNLPSVEMVDLGAQGVVAARIDDEVIVFVETPGPGELVVPVMSGVSVVRVFGLPADAEVKADGAPLAVAPQDALSIEGADHPLWIQWAADPALGNPQATR